MQLGAGPAALTPTPHPPTHQHRTAEHRTKTYTRTHPLGAKRSPVRRLADDPPFRTMQVQAQLSDKGERLVVGCKSGKRSEMACKLMAGAGEYAAWVWLPFLMRGLACASAAAATPSLSPGYSGLSNMVGGFDAWLANGHPVEK